MNLVRIPVSILPGQVTRQGFGAEITVTAQPVISDDLLPTTFQNLVVNDVVDFLGLPLVRVTEQLPKYLNLRQQQDRNDDVERLILQLDQVYDEAKSKPIPEPNQAEYFKTSSEPLLLALLEYDEFVQAFKKEIAKVSAIADQNDAASTPETEIGASEYLETLNFLEGVRKSLQIDKRVFEKGVKDNEASIRSRGAVLDPNSTDDSGFSESNSDWIGEMPPETPKDLFKQLSEQNRL